MMGLSEHEACSPTMNRVPLYFSRHIYCKFVLGMRPDYMSMPFSFYGSGRGCIYEHRRACRDPFLYNLLQDWFLYQVI